MSSFKEILSACGLSQSEAAGYFKASIDSVKSWCSGRRNVPEGVWKEMYDLFCDVQEAIEAMKLRNERYEWDTELSADDIRELFADCDLPKDLPDGALVYGFSIAKLTARIPPFIEKM